MPKSRRRTGWQFYKRGRGSAFEFGTTENKSSQQSERELNSGPLKYKFIALTAVNGKITAWCHKDMSLKDYTKVCYFEKLLCWQVFKNHNCIIHFNLLQVCPSVPHFVPSFIFLGGYFSCYHLVWWQFPLLECWQISPVTQFSPLSHPWDFIREIMWCYSIECIALYFLLR